MCTVCGCAGDGATIEGGAVNGHAPHGSAHPGANGHDHGRAHHHHHDHHHNHDGAHGDLDYGAGPARAHAPGLSQARMVEIETDILSKNDGYAARNRRRFEESATLALNFVSSPGSGKTTLLVKTIEALAGRFPVAVIEGDQQTAADADRIRATGAPAIQVNTGKGCHLDAHMVGHAVDHLAPEAHGALFIENVGNLVCPAAFDLGEDAKVAIFSVVEGADKPLKYPDMFAASQLVILSKTDLAPHTDADLDAMELNCVRVNPSVAVIRLSARTGEGMDAWLGWLAARRKALLDRLAAAAEARLAALRAAE